MKPLNRARVAIILGLFCGLLILAGSSLAQDPPEPNTPADNACYTGGDMEGKCDTDWEWRCGWHLARWQADGGWFGAYPMLDECVSLLPPRPVVDRQQQQPAAPMVFPSAGCIATAVDFLDFGGGFAVAAPYPLYPDATCGMTIVTVFGLNHVYAPPPFNADLLCQIAFGQNVANGPLGDNVYQCA